MEVDQAANSDRALEARVRQVARAKRAHITQRIQSLWSGYGSIVRIAVDGAEQVNSAGQRLTSVVAKWVEPPALPSHPRGFNTDVSHQRKLASYRVERAWYDFYAHRCSAACRVATCYLTREERGCWLFLFEDLDVAGYSVRANTLSEAQFDACLRWLANFHASFLYERQPSPDAGKQSFDPFPGLWPVGTYWHLDTRPDEFDRLEDPRLREAASELDTRLVACRFLTLVHGDAKAQNFCFSDGSRSDVAAVDFQYVGRGCGMKDVAYFLSSCLSEEECEQRAEAALETYFEELRAALSTRDSLLDCDALETEWRSLYPLAWADFVRFLLGWAKEHYKLHGYSRRMTRLALERL